MSGLVPITAISPLTPLQSIEPMRGGDSASVQFGNSSDFSAFLQNAVDNLEQTQSEASVAVEGLTTGAISDFHVPVIALQKAALSLDLTVNVRNKILDAYHEIMRMQI
ncbi:Flagellar hook-basal body complex protein fliE [Syntrophobotulus glycolicus DSM 8271]|uniref:Flagellar hook-basal body complex protein FliE n=1 Tax=Syntrophobotulus glycolicus (strain DSM 8271 / FlGlyR) TaxID=645991 RepID=F0SZF2_SYNGF|nr:Flagellar hook-basal body complex protein fliE [Syntrophobotulus glycolicus DSM 8271]